MSMLAATPLPRPTSALRLPFSPRARAQIGLFLLAYLVYSAARFVTIGDLPDAQDHARWIVNLENATGTGVEATVQNAFDGTWVMWTLNRLYLIAQLGVIPAVLIFLYKRNTQIYATLRNTILATWLISVPVYGLFPVAPPRLADIGITDTITSSGTVAMDSSLTTSFYNELAAVPSLHVGFAVAVGFALFAALRNPALRFLALLWGPIIGLAVVATGNHFVFDMVAGVVASVAGYGLGAAAARIRVQRPSNAGLGPAFAEA
jgi:membrane-associated phospholipid phosphatase